MTARIYISCDDLEAAGIPSGDQYGHCGSCHDDAGDGFSELMDIEPPKNANGKPSRILAFVCCGWSWSEPTRSQWAAALKEYRKRVK